MIAASAFALFFTSVLSVHADVVSDLQQKISDGTNAIQKLEQEMAQYQSQIDATSKQADTLKNQINTLELTDKKLTTQIKTTQTKITNAQLTISQLDDKIAAEEAALGAGHDALAAALREQSELDDVSLVEATLAGTSFSDFWKEFSELSSVEGGVNSHLADVRDIETQLTANKAEKEGEKAQLVSLNSDLSDQHQLTVENKAEQNQLLTATKDQEANYQKMLAERKAEYNELQNEINSYEAQLKIAINPASLPESGSHVLSYPLDNVRITQYFGDTPFATQNPQVYNGHGHDGIDLAAPIGTPVKAALDGVVLDTGDTDLGCPGVSFGRWVMIKHANGLSTLYAHLSVIKATPGEQVSTGDVIGLSGATGYVTGPHVHFGVYATAGLQISSDYISKVCGTKMKLPLASLNAYLNPLSYL